MDIIELVLYGIYILIIGLCVGSFLNVVILRSFSEESIVFPPSKCPKCNNKLKWYHNIPLLSYMFLKGKCAFCKEKISIQYPIVEFLTGVMFLIAFIAFGFSLKTLFAWIFIGFLIVMSVTDIKETIVFDKHVYSFIIVMYLISLIMYPIEQWWVGLLGILAAFVIFEILARFGYLFTNSRAFGEGDTFIAMGIGAIVGPQAVVAVTILAIIIDVIFMYPIMLYNAIKNKNKNMIMGLILAIIAIVMGILFNLYGQLLNSILMYSSLLIGVIVPAAFSVFLIIKDIKSKKVEDLMMPPFGPALAIAGVIVYFAIGLLSI